MNSNNSICFSSSSLIPFLTSLLFLFFIPTSISASHGGNESDRLALLSFKSMITDDPYGALSSWNTSVHFCEWSGVLCGKRHRRVTVVRIISQGLVGFLSPHIGNLSFLRQFHLRNNSFQGIIPHELGHLSKLRLLDLESNNFNGVIPTNFSHCSYLEKVSLAYNNLVGGIPKEISCLSKLSFLSLYYNKLTGGIPSFMGNFTSMEVLYIDENPLGGTIPDTIGNMRSLREFLCFGCNLGGSIPHSLFNISLLANLSLGNNQLTGSLPLNMGDKLPNLVGFQLAYNQLMGLLPPSISNCSKLIYLEMLYNNFSGKLMINFAKLRDIVEVSLGHNFFESGEDSEMEVFDYLKNCNRLEILNLRTCKFQGKLPTSIGNLSDQVYYLNLGGNRFHGNLPSSIGNLVSLTVLDVSGNRISGEIPSTIGNLQKLQYVSLYDNQFLGSIPDAIGNLSSLNKLYLNSNRLSGLIPSSLGNCHQLLDLSLGNNKLTGQIPKQLLQLSSLSMTVNLSQNNLYGSLPNEIGDLKMMSSLDLSYNKLSGNIPSSIGGCTSLLSLYLQENLFQGMIPPSVILLKGLVQLDLSHNNLSGEIPSFLEKFSLEYLNISFNDFMGEVPIVGVFANASGFSAVGNNRLCGGFAELGLPKCKEMEKHKKRFPLFLIVILVTSTLVILLCLVYVWYKKKKKDQQTQSSMNEQFFKISYNQLLKATNGFSKANLIGKGGFSFVYKGILDHDDSVVAIKVINLQNQGAHNSFTRECEALRSIRHRNLLKIITSCSSIDFQGNDFKALVYEFMANGNLDDWLHSRVNTSRFNFLQRINILFDVLSALDYLHNHCATTIIHGDLKPVNILLDDDMVAHVGDFGLARFLGTHSNKTSSTGIRGTIGYAAPEYGTGSKMTTSGDVYSFGIIVLEVMTGKKPTNKIFQEGLSLHKYAYMTLPDHVTDVIDDELLNSLQESAISKRSIENTRKIEECLTSIVKIGVSCSQDSPSQRMKLENVIHELQHIRHTFQNI